MIDTRNAPEFAHFRAEDGTCRLIPTRDLASRTHLAVWTRAHSRFDPTAKNAPRVSVARKALISSPAWLSVLESALREDLDQLRSVADGRTRAQLVARLAEEIPQLLWVDPLVGQVISLLNERDADFVRMLAVDFSQSQIKAGRSRGRLQKECVAVWEAVEEWRLKNGRAGLADDCRRIAEERMGAQSDADAVHREAERLRINHQRAQRPKGTVLVHAVALVGCPHPGEVHASKDVLPDDGKPRIELCGEGTRGNLLQTIRVLEFTGTTHTVGTTS